jgi:hypothetical protein
MLLFGLAAMSDRPVAHHVARVTSTPLDLQELVPSWHLADDYTEQLRVLESGQGSNEQEQAWFERQVELVKAAAGLQGTRATASVLPPSLLSSNRKLTSLLVCACSTTLGQIIDCFFLPWTVFVRPDPTLFHSSSSTGRPSPRTYDDRRKLVVLHFFHQGHTSSDEDFPTTSSSLDVDARPSDEQSE